MQMFGSFLGILPKALDGKGGSVHPAFKEMFGGVWSYVTTWADVEYIVAHCDGNFLNESSARI